MSIKFHEGLDDMQAGPFLWTSGAALDFRVMLPDETTYTPIPPAAADTWALVGSTHLQNADHVSTEWPDANRSTNLQGLMQLTASHSWTPSAQPNQVLVVFGRSFGAPVADKIGYFIYLANDDVGNNIPFVAQNNLVTVDFPTGVYQA